jgi:hypothetical protein
LTFPCSFPGRSFGGKIVGSEIDKKLAERKGKGKQKRRK